MLSLRQLFSLDATKMGQLSGNTQPIIQPRSGLFTQVDWRASNSPDLSGTLNLDELKQALPQGNGVKSITQTRQHTDLPYSQALLLIQGTLGCQDRPEAVVSSFALLQPMQNRGFFIGLIGQNNPQVLMCSFDGQKSNGFTHSDTQEAASFTVKDMMFSPSFGTRPFEMHENCRLLVINQHVEFLQVQK